jgi:hypothetical protein
MRTFVIWMAGFLLTLGGATSVGCSDDDSSNGCIDECVAGTTICVGDAVETCGNYDEDSCLEFGGYTACGANESCSLGVCSDPVICTDECTPGTTVCVVNAVAACGEFDSDTCADLATPEPCAEGETCSGGVCSASCTNECTAGQTECLNLFTERVCGNFDTDDCLDWGPPMACGTGEICVVQSGGGACEASACGQSTDSFDEQSCSMQWSCPVDMTYGVYCYESEGGGDWMCGAYDCLDCMPICEWSSTLTGLAACQDFSKHCSLPPPAP